MKYVFNGITKTTVTTTTTITTAATTIIKSLSPSPTVITTSTTIPATAPTTATLAAAVAAIAQIIIFIVRDAVAVWITVLAKSQFKRNNALLYLLLCLQLSIANVETLTCMACTNNQDETTELHKFRISATNTHPTCTMEPIQCEPDQDACVTIVMRMGNTRFWIGSGCDYQKNFRHIACKTEPVYTRNIQDGQIYERRTPQRTCVCTLNLCNRSSKQKAQFLFSYTVLLLVYLLYFYDFR